MRPCVHSWACWARASRAAQQDGPGREGGKDGGMEGWRDGGREGRRGGRKVGRERGRSRGEMTVKLLTSRLIVFIDG